MYFTKGIICAADTIVLVFSTLFFLSNLFLTNEFFSLTDVKSMNYDMNINGTYMVDYLCLLNSTMENRNVTFSLDKINNLPLYISKNNLVDSDNIKYFTLSFLISIKYFLFSRLTNSKSFIKDNCFYFLKIICEFLTVILMIILVFFATVWLFNGIDMTESNIIPAASISKNFFINITNEENLIFNSNVIVNFTSGLLYYPDKSIFLNNFNLFNGYYVSLPLLINGLDTCINMINLNVSDLFSLKNITLQNYFLDDMECENTPLQVNSVSLLETKYISNLPKSIKSVFTTFFLLFAEAIFFIIAAMGALCSFLCFSCYFLKKRE